MSSLTGRSRAVLDRTTFATSRLLDFASIKELTAQTGHDLRDWPLVILKELVDNAADACEEAGIAPEISITVDADGIIVSDNGPGLPVETIKAALDFAVRVSSREAYVSPTRGAQGNALKTIFAMPFVLERRFGENDHGRVEIETGGIRHVIDFRVDRIGQEPVINHTREPSDVRIGTVVNVLWPVSASKLNLRKRRGPIFTNRQGVRLAQSTHDPECRLVRRRPIRDHRHRSIVDQMETVGPDVAALVHGRAP
jgi:hypothetical protein